MAMFDLLSLRPNSRSSRPIPLAHNKNNFFSSPLFSSLKNPRGEWPRCARVRAEHSVLRGPTLWAWEHVLPGQPRVGRGIAIGRRQSGGISWSERSTRRRSTRSPDPLRRLARRSASTLDPQTCQFFFFSFFFSLRLLSRIIPNNFLRTDVLWIWDNFFFFFTNVFFFFAQAALSWIFRNGYLCAQMINIDRRVNMVFFKLRLLRHEYFEIIISTQIL